MSPVRHAWRGSFLAALGAAALIGAVATAPAHAAPASKQHRNVHKTPKVPLVVDGVKYKPKQIHRFDGRPLYSAVAADGKSLIAFTKLAPYKKYLRSLGVELPSAGDAKSPTARSSAAGQWSGVCTDRFRQGHCYNINSGWGFANLRALDGCNFWGNCQVWENNIEWAENFGPGLILFDLPNFNTAAGSIFLPGGSFDLNSFGWSNRAESLGVPW